MSVKMPTSRPLPTVLGYGATALIWIAYLMLLIAGFDPLAPDMIAAVLLPVIATALLGGAMLGLVLNVLLLTGIVALHWLEGDITQIWRSPVAMVPLVGLSLTFGFRRRIEAAVVNKLEQDARIDRATGLMLRPLFERRLQELVDGNKSTKGAGIATFYLDLDQFSLVTSVHGDEAGERTLAAVGAILREQAGPDGLVARAGPDEFLVAVPNVKDKNAAGSLAIKLKRAVVNGTAKDGNGIAVQGSMGLCLIPADVTDARSAVMSAEDAMRHVKSTGKNSIAFSSRDMRARRARRMELEEQLAGALKNGEFELQYQPQYALGTKTVVGVEALLRWWNQKLGVVAPSEFIPVAEQSGHILDIGKWVLEEASAQLAAWKLDGVAVGKMAVNVSVLQLMQADFVDYVLETIAKNGLEPADLEIEIVESVLIRDPSSVIKKLRRLSREGVRIALDDFGTGYSSLEYLANLPVDTIKIEKSFLSRLKQLQARGDNSVLVEAVCALATQMQKSVVAEGVETEAQWNFLAEVGCAYAQGYFFSRPLGVSGVEKLVRDEASQLGVPRATLDDSGVISDRVTSGGPS